MIRTRTFVFTIAVLAVLTLAVGAVLAFETYFIGKVTVAELPAKPALYVEHGPGRRVAVLRSEITAQRLGMGAHFEAHPQYWKMLLQTSGWRVDVMPQAQLAAELPSYDLLVLPSVVCLSQEDKDAIRAFLRQGKGVVATWATGARDEQGAWLGWAFLEELTGADGFEVPDWPGPRYLAFNARSPITVGVAGKRAQVESPELLSAIALNVDAYWSDFRLYPADARRPTNFLGSVLHNRFAGGRVVWLGFQENSAVGNGPDKSLIDAMLLNGARWAAGDGVIALEPWPAPYASVVVPALNIGQGADNASYPAETLVRSHARASFFFPADPPPRRAGLLAVLRPAGEIAWLAPQQVAAPGRNWRMWWETLRDKWRLRRFSGQSVSGVSIAYGSIPNAAVPRLAAGRYRYFLVGAQGHTVMPETIVVSNGWGSMQRAWRLQRLTRMSDDDLGLSPLGLTGLEHDWIAQRIATDADIIASLGGLYVFSFHTTGLSAPQYAGVLAQLLDKWQRESAWVASGADVASWWSKREQVSVKASPASDASMRITVEYAGQDPITDVALSIYCPREITTASIAGLNGTPGKPEVVTLPDENRIQLRLPPLAAGRYSYEVHY